MDLASSLTVIGYFAPVIFEKWFDWIPKYLSGIDPDLRASLEKLKIHMLSTHMVISHIRADTNDGLLKLLKELKEAAYEADDLLDHLNYFRLKKQVEEGDNMDNHSFHSKLKKAGVAVLKDHTVEEAASTLQVQKLTIDDPALLTVLLKTQSLHYLQSLMIDEFELTYWNIEEEIYSHLTSLKKLEIFDCYNLKSLQPAYLKSLPSLEELYVIYCPNLQSLPLLPASLKTLSVKLCYTLQSLPLMPASLQTLSVISCRLVPKRRYQEGGEDWHNISHVNNIIWEGYN